MVNLLEQVTLTLAPIPSDMIAGFTINRNLENKTKFDIFAMDVEGNQLVCVEVNLEFDAAMELTEVLNQPYNKPEEEYIPNSKPLFNPKKKV